MAQRQLRTREEWVLRADDASTAVVVHGLLNSVTVIKAAARLLESYWDRLDPNQRSQMLDDIVRHVDLVGGVLTDMVQGVPDPLDTIDLSDEA